MVHVICALGGEYTMTAARIEFEEWRALSHGNLIFVREAKQLELKCIWWVTCGY